MKRTVGLLLVLAVTWCLLERPASACGGCVSPPNTFTAVQSHRMVIKLGIDETILWDQFIYSGAPEEFAWLLPVPTSDVVVELADGAFVQQIDEQTTPIVQPASPSPCSAAASGGGCGFGGDGFGGGFGPGPVEGVQVYDHAVVGPYETVTLGSEDPNALFAWLAGNGYAYPDSAIATLEHYTEQGGAFVVLRLRPGAEVSAMQPVRVRFRGFMGTFPLEMVVVGGSGVIDLSLWVIADQRYQAFNYPTVAIDESELAWDWAASRSSYGELFDEVVDRNGGRGWVTEYAATLEDSELAAVLSEQAPEDYVVATEQIHYPYITRLRTRMLVDHIDQDLQLAPAADATDVSRELFAQRNINYECTEYTSAASGPVRGSAGSGGKQMLLLVALAFLAVTCRRRGTAITSTCLPPGEARQ